MDQREESDDLANEERPRRALVLLVEDDMHFAEALGALLEEAGYQVVRCSGGERALGYLSEGRLPDLIVLDLLLAGMNGWEFRVAQKRTAAWAAIPVIAISADHSPKAEAIDAALYLSKPFQNETFLAAVQRVVGDLEQRRELARASEVQRLVSLGSLVGGIAHEINNPLTFLMGSLEMLQRQLVGFAHPLSAAEPFSVATALRALHRASEGAERIASVLRSVSMFAYADTQTNEPLNVHDVLESSLQVASNELRHSARVERIYTSVPLVYGNAAKLGQVFLNLVLNALSAIREAGEPDPAIHVSTTLRDDRVVVTISDTATKIDAATRSGMFDPLSSTFTGRASLHFGLAVSREVIESMGGTIEVESLGPSGSAFLLCLPRFSPASYPAPEVQPWSRGLLPKRPTIMIVDDEPLICEYLEAMLQEQHEVAAFSSPRAALASVLAGSFDLVLCDVMMPELDGIEFYERLVRDRPDMAGRFVFITGGAFTEQARAFLKRNGLPTLRKPCSREALLERVQEALRKASSKGEPTGPQPR